MRRQVGCILTDENQRVLATGYNGPASGLPHCIEEPCPGAGLATGTGLDKCEAIHAEQNALIQCADVRRVAHIYTVVSPCVTCTKLLLATPARALYFAERYAHDHEARRLWQAAGRDWVHVPMIYIQPGEGITLWPVYVPPVSS